MKKVIILGLLLCSVSAYAIHQDCGLDPVNPSWTGTLSGANATISNNATISKNLNTNTLTVGGTSQFSAPITVQNTATGTTTLGVDIKNGGTAAGSVAYLDIYNNLDNYAGIRNYGSGYSGTFLGANRANTFSFFNVSLPLVTFGSLNSAPLKFGVNNAEVMEIAKTSVTIATELYMVGGKTINHTLDGLNYTYYSSGANRLAYNAQVGKGLQFRVDGTPYLDITSTAVQLFNGASISTWTATGLDVYGKVGSGGFNIKGIKTDAQLLLITPVVGDCYISSTDYALWIASGATACGFKRIASGATP